MEQKRHTTETIIRILRGADSGKNIETVCRAHHISAASFYRGKKKFGGMELKDARKCRELEKEDGELKKMLADSFLKIRVLEAVNAKKGGALCRSGARRWAWGRLDSARCEGLVGIWGCTVPATAICKKNPPTGCCGFTGRSSTSRTSTRAWVTVS